MKTSFLLVLVVIMAACTLAVPGLAPPSPDFSATKLFQLTAEMETATAGAPQNQATSEAVLATKTAGGTAEAETMTAEPTLIPTAAIPPGSPACRARDLQAVFTGAQGATQTIVFEVSVTNLGSQPCFLQQWPQALLVDPQGDPLEVSYSYSDPSYDLKAVLRLPPGRTANFGFQWGNWCLPAVQAGVQVRLLLAGEGGTLTIPTGITTGGVCNDASSPSWVGIFPFSLP
jgi:hypothetical protein